MSGNNIGIAYLQVVPKLDMKSLSGQGASAGKSAGAGFSKAFSGGAGGIGSAASKVFGIVSKASAAALASASATIAAVSKQAFESYSTYEQLSGGISKLFGTVGQSLDEYAAAQGKAVDAVSGEYAKLEQAQSAVFENAQNAYKTVGMSANEYMENVSGFAAALTTSLGGDTVKAAAQADVAMRAISDNVNTFGSDIDSVTTAFQGFAKQNYTMLDNLKLGYGGTKSEMERLIADANEWGAANGKASDLSIESFSDVITAIEQIQEKQRIAGTTAREAGTTIEGSMNAAKAAWSNLLAEFGKDDGNIEGAMQALVDSIMGDGTDENRGVMGNVVPRIRKIVENVAEQLPGIIAAVAPKVAEAFVQMLDSATGGLATRALNILKPLTTTIGEVFGGMGTWFGENKGAIDDVVSSFETFAGVVSGALATALEVVSPIIGDLASASLPLLSSALEFAGGFISAASNLVSNLGTAFAPLTDAIAPVAEAIGSWLVDALSDLGEYMSGLDFSGFAEAVADTLQGVVDFVGDCVDALTGFFGDVAKFLADPIGAIQDGFAKLVGDGTATQKAVSDSFGEMDRSVGASLANVGSSIDQTNAKKLDSKSATATVTGNAVDGSARQGVGNTDKAIDSLSSKTVDASVTGNAKDASIADRIWSTVDAIRNLTSKSVDVTTNVIRREYQAAGGIRAHADGFIANRYGRGVPLDIVGEDGAEAIIPLTNKRYVRPFADTVAEQMLSRMGDFGGVTVNLSYDASSDATAIARDIAYALEQVRRTGA